MTYTLGAIAVGAVLLLWGALSLLLGPKDRR